jgi:hypothetical protein
MKPMIIRVLVSRKVCHSARLVGTPSEIGAVSTAVSIISPSGRVFVTPDPPPSCQCAALCIDTHYLETGILKGCLTLHKLVQCDRNIGCCQ